MMARALRRVAWAIVAVWAAVTVTFAIGEVIPGDPAQMAAGPQARPQEVARVRAQLGLGRPVAARYGLFLHRLAHLAPSPDARGGHESCAALGPIHLDLGRSYVQRRPVVDIVAERLPRSAALAAVAVIVQTLLGVTIGAFAARRRGSPWDRATVAATLLGVSVPTFLVGLALQYLFAQKLGWLPLDGFGKTPAARAAAIVLPAATLGLFGTAYAARVVRDEVAACLALDHVRTARAKGASPGRVLVLHALRNALAPVVTIAGLDLGVLVGGAVVVETLFRWPGLGIVSVNAMMDRDGPVVLGTVLVTSTAVVAINLLVDLVYPWLDPRAHA